MAERHIVAMGGDAPSLFEFVLSLARRRPPRLLWVGTAGAEDPWRALEV